MADDLPPGVVRDGDGWKLRKGEKVPEGWAWQYPNGTCGTANRGVPASFVRDVPIRTADHPDDCENCNGRGWVTAKVPCGGTGSALAAAPTEDTT